jgi:hypothetical protein
MSEKQGWKSPSSLANHSLTLRFIVDFFPGVFSNIVDEHPRRSG